MTDEGVYVSTDRAVACQWGPIKCYRIAHQPKLLDLGDFGDRKAREFVVAAPWEIDKVDPDDLPKEDFDIEAVACSCRTVVSRCCAVWVSTAIGSGMTPSCSVICSTMPRKPNNRQTENQERTGQGADGSACCGCADKS